MNLDKTFLCIVRLYAQDISEISIGKEISKPLFLELFNYYSNNGEMPYGVAKARDGDPFIWITKKLESDLV